MYLDAVVGILVGILRGHTLAEWGESIGQAAVLLLLCTLFWRELALAADVVQCLVDIHIA